MHERISVNSLCFPGAGLAEMEGYWRALSPRRVSFRSDLLDDGVETARRILVDGGYQMESMTHLFLWGRHLDAGQETVAAEQAKFDRVIDAMAELGGRSIYLMTGGHGSLTWDEAAEAFAAAIAPCVQRARAAGLEIAVETASSLYADAHIAHTLADTVRLAEIAGIGVCVDIYACWTEAGLQQSLGRAGGRVQLVQVSDYLYGDRSFPSRAVPGDGDIPLQRIIGWLLDAGYAGAFDLELIGPRIDAEGPLEATRRAAENLSRILTSLGI